MSADEHGSIVNWGLAERVAHGIAGDAGGEIAAGAYPADELARTCADALAAAASYTGMRAADEAPRPELIDRHRWADNGLRALAFAAEALEREVAAELAIGGPVGSAARSLMGVAAGTEAGLAVGYAARRVLGQYDVALLGPQRPPRLLFVGANIERTRAELEAERLPFLRWISLHETTHALQFGAVPWLLEHTRDLVAALIAGAASAFDLRELPARAVRMIRSEPGGLLRAAMRGELVRILADPEQRRQLDRLQALMTVIEGHAEHVMDACAAELDPGIERLRARVNARRAGRNWLDELLSRLLGLELKLRQYERGKAFCDAVVAEAGPAGLTRVWESPDRLPGDDELDQPERWLERVGSPSRLR